MKTISMPKPVHAPSDIHVNHYKEEIFRLAVSSGMICSFSLIFIV